MAFPFAKMNGAGNAILVLDLRQFDSVLQAEQMDILASQAGSDFDQAMVLHAPKVQGTAAFVRIYNRDGSLAGACGNGTRCVGWYLMEHEAQAEAITLQTQAGLLNVWKEQPLRYRVDMGKPKFDWQDIPLSEPFQDTRFIELAVGPIGNPVMHSPSVVSMGNPHAVFWVKDVNAIDLAKIGPVLEHHPLFPEGANISTAQIIDRENVLLRVWERGAGLTLACGSAACAVVASGARLRKVARQADIHLPGGVLSIHYRADNEHIEMAGPVELEKLGELAL
jgi:diaminopimelate epimerase